MKLNKTLTFSKDMANAESINKVITFQKQRKKSNNDKGWWIVQYTDALSWNITKQKWLGQNSDNHQSVCTVAFLTQNFPNIPN